MTALIEVQLPDGLVDFIDSEIAADRAKSREAVVVHALERERRRRFYERDAQILADQSVVDLDDLAALAATIRLDVD